jgi:hypothetical protein
VLAGKITAIILALFFLFITVVYNYSPARLIFVSGPDQRLPKAMSHANKARGAGTSGTGAEPLPAGAGRHRATGADG